jgi:VWFA-related protein
VTVVAQDLPPPTFRSGIDVVHVDVTVLDSDRRPVRGLTAADFTVIEDGKPRPIVAFAPVELPPPVTFPEGTASWVREVPNDVATNAIPPEGRLVVVVMGRTEDMTEIVASRRIAHAVFDGLAPGDLGGLVFMSEAYNIGAKQNFTDDTALLHQAVDRTVALTGAVDAPAGSGFAAAQGRAALTADAPEPPSQTDCFCGVCMFDKIGDVATAVAGVPGRRKQIVYAGSSFPRAQLPPSDVCADHVRQARGDMERRLSQANVAISVVNPAGSEGNSGNLPYLPELTGGRYVLYDNHAEKQVPAILDESASYYVLAFTASERSASRNGLNRIEVKVARPNVTVQARTAYEVGKTPRALEAEMRKAPIVRALESTLPATDLSMSLVATPFPIPGRETAHVIVTLRTDPPRYDAAALSEGRKRAAAAREDEISVVVALLDPNGKVVASTKHSGAIPWAPEAVGPAAYELLSRLEVKPGRYEIRAVTDVQSGERSGVYGFVEVPKFSDAPLSLSGIVLQVSPRSMTGPKGALDLLPVVPTARREFEFGDTVTAFVRTHATEQQASPVTVTARILDVTGRALHEHEAAATDLTYQHDLPIDDLPPGEYLLEIRASGPGEREAIRHSRFKVK